MSLTWEERFDELAEADAGERDRRLAALDGEDPGLARLLRELLAADAGGGELLSIPLADRAPGFLAAALAGHRASPAGRDRSGERIGPYRLLSLLGRGGMAEVWLAERSDGEIEYRAALKLIRPELGTEAILARFLRERRILARLEHPAIARLLDGGRSESGEPYFVLELVDGTPITDWCAARGASLEERLRLVIEVCEAVDYAHRNLIVHRDLKPANILVDQAGRPKLLDFGIAKLIAPEPTGERAVEDATRLFTPSYAAPEQILGQPVTTATDIYALGVLLFELLTGEKPHLRAAALLPDLAREIGGEILERPSERLRRSAPSEARRLAGDLDTIVAKALHREPERRYASASALADDLRRHLSGHPVAARPDSFAYRGGRFMRRHRWAAAAALLVVASLVTGMATALWQARIARAEARRADRVRGFLVEIFREADPSRTQGATITAREILETGAARVERELAGEPAVSAELLDAISQVQFSLGLFEAAEKRAAASLALRSKLYGPDALETAASRITLARAIFERGDPAAARREMEAGRPAIAGAEESEQADRWNEAYSTLLAAEGKTNAAIAVTRRRLEMAEAGEGPESLRAARWRMILMGQLGDSSRIPAATALARPALDALERTPGASPVEIAEARVEVAEVLGLAGRKEESVRLLASGVALASQTLGPRHPVVAFDEIKYGYGLLDLRRYDEAERVLRDSISILAPLKHYEAAAALRYLGIIDMERGRFVEAEHRFAAAEEVFRSHFGPDHPYPIAARVSRGEALLRQGRLAAAEDLLRELLPRLEAGEGPWQRLLRSLLRHLGEVRRLRGDAAEALALHRRAREVTLSIYGTAEHSAVAVIDYQIVLDHLARPTPQGLAEARILADGGIATLRKLDPGSPRLGELLAARERLVYSQ
ncbi:MAG: eukaryotic-like serine/threonine-protein kinase [Acidobacteriota bacterium]|nr:eukaryotic-like serine/threonine-protein kinase [Acidobacteriota bacterium]